MNSLNWVHLFYGTGSLRSGGRLPGVRHSFHPRFAQSEWYHRLHTNLSDFHLKAVLKNTIG